MKINALSDPSGEGPFHGTAKLCAVFQWSDARLKLLRSSRFGWLFSLALGCAAFGSGGIVLPDVADAQAIGGGNTSTGLATCSVGDVAPAEGCFQNTTASTQNPDALTGWFFGAEGQLVTPYFERDILGADENTPGPNTPFELLSFDWDADGAYRGWIGFESSSGFGWSITQSFLDQSTDFSRTEGLNGLEVAFNPGAESAAINVQGTLNAMTSLDLQATDLEFWYRRNLGPAHFRWGAGVRYGTIDRRFFASETGGTNEAVSFHHSFEGVGPSLGYELEVPVGHGFSLYSDGRAAILFGDHHAIYTDENGLAGGTSGQSNTSGIVTTVDAGAGVQWQRRLEATGDVLTLRAGVTGQAWFGGGGWDLYDGDDGATFPQHAGSFGSLGLIVSAQYAFDNEGAEDGCGVFVVGCGSSTEESFNSGWYLGAQGGLVSPYFDSDILGGESGGGPTPLTLFSFDWDLDGAYQGWLGYQTGSGFSVELSHARLRHGASFSRAEVAPGNLNVYFDTSADSAKILVNGTLNANTSLDLHATDLEFAQSFQLERLGLRVGAGLRYGSIDRTFLATETDDTEFVDFDHEFSGFGPSVHYEMDLPLSGGFSLYGGGRAALLFGEHNASFTEDAESGSSSSMGFVGTLDSQVGLQWQGRPSGAPGELTLRAGIEGQAWLNGGGWHFFRNGSAADFPQHLGNFGAFGLVASAQYAFGASSAPDDAMCGVFDTSCNSESPEITSAGWIVGAQGGLVVPHFEHDVLGADETNGGNSTLRVLSFDWGANGTYAGWFGYEAASGFGWSLTHEQIVADTLFSQAVGAGQLEVHFDVNIEDADIIVDGTLNAQNSLDIQTTDLEFWQTTDLGGLTLQLGAGLRYAAFDRGYLATETGDTEFIRFDHAFSGFGPSLSYEVVAPIGHGFSLYNNARAALVYGEHSSTYTTETPNDDTGSSVTTSLIGTLDSDVGVQWEGDSPGLAGAIRLRAGLTGQAWLGGGGWDLYQPENGGVFPQHAGNFGMIGVVASAQVKF